MSDGINFVVPDDELRNWRLLLPDNGKITCNGIFYHSLDSFKYFSIFEDARTQSLIISAPPNAFVPTVIDRTPPPSQPTTGRGAYLNYDLSLADVKGYENVGGFFEGVWFDRHGILDNSFLAQNRGIHPVVRLESTWQHDEVADMWRLRLGDSITRSGMIGGSSRFAGVQWGKEFALNPRFIRYPMPSFMEGVANMPTLLDVYVNEFKAFSENLPTGPFEIPNIPAVTGSGSLTVVTKDLLGRQTITTQPYYLAPELLRQGLSKFSYEAGFVRRNYGIESNAYGDLLFAATHRMGITNQFTAEGHLEIKGKTATVSVGENWAPWTIGVFSAALAGSESGDKAGGRSFVSYEYIGRMFSGGISGILGSRNYRDAVTEVVGTTLKRQLTANLGISFNSFGSISGSITERKNFDKFGDDMSTNIYTGSYTLPLFKGNLSVLYVQNSGISSSHVAFIQYQKALDSRTTISPRISADDNSLRSGVEVQRSLPLTGRGYSFQAAAERDEDGNGRFESRMFRRGESCDLSAEYSSLLGVRTARAGITGALVLIDNGFYESRRIDKSFALVKVPKMSDVMVNVNNLEAGTTNRNGELIVTDLNPNEENTIVIDAEMIPLTATLDTFRDKTVPYDRSGTIVTFMVHTERSAIITLQTADGRPLPAGTFVSEVTGGIQYPVGKNGIVYLTGIKNNEIDLSGTVPTGACTAKIVLPSSDNEIRVSKPFICR